MVPNPKLYEINTRIWLNNFNNNGKKATFNDVPDSVIDGLAEKGFDFVWLMGVWKTCPSTIDKYCFRDFLVSSYQKALKDFSREDVIGSPYAIDTYVVNETLGGNAALECFRERLHSRGMKLFLDFVPNHFSVESKTLKTNPEIFLSGDEELFSRDSYTFFRSGFDGKIYAHGRDPFFPAWEDTVQVNYFSPEAVEYMTAVLNNISAMCDGVRCDMAMLLLENVFGNTWGGALDKMGYKKSGHNFWKEAIAAVKKNNPEFIFMAETYWDLEWKLQQSGFDFTYDKNLLERLQNGQAEGVLDHLRAESEFQRKSVRFIENHDEERSAAAFGRNKSKAAAVIMSTVPGMHFYYDGQFEGRRIKLPVQLGRQPEETPGKCYVQFYSRLLEIMKDEIFRKGAWTLLETIPAWESNYSHHNILAWKWEYEGRNVIVVVNYSEWPSQCRLRFPVSGNSSVIVLVDLLNDQIYHRTAREITSDGLFIELDAFQSHIFTF